MLMRRHTVQGIVLVFTMVLLAPRFADAQVDQAVSFQLGYFGVRGEDARIDDDVVLANLPVHLFNVGDFSGALVGGEWLFGFGRTLEAGVGLGAYRRTVPSVDRDLVHPDGREIEQDFRLRIVPITGVVRFFPLGRDEAIQPYVGAGVGFFNWRYSEVGEFVAPDFTIFRGRFVDSGTDLGALGLAGVRVPVGHYFSVGGEVRYQRAEGSLNPEVGFLGDRIDLGGLTGQLVLNWRF
jgi:hypothetical protein